MLMLIFGLLIPLALCGLTLYGLLSKWDVKILLVLVILLAGLSFQGGLLLGGAYTEQEPSASVSVKPVEVPNVRTAVDVVTP